MVAGFALRFPKQYQDAGLKAKLPLLGGGTTFDEFVLPSLGDEAIGAISPLIYSAGARHAGQPKFVKEYRDEVRARCPSYYSETCYTTRRWIDEAAKALGGKVEDRDEVPGRAPQGGDPRRPRGAAQARRPRQPHPEHLRPEGRAARTASCRTP